MYGLDTVIQLTTNRTTLLTQVLMFSTRLCKLGANHPSGRVLFKNLGWRYLVFLARLPRLNCLLEVRDSRIAKPRCFSSAANTTSPVESLTNAIPVNFAPGSIFNLRGDTGESGRDSLRIIVNGNCLNTAALVESRGNIISRPSLLNLSVRLSPHSASDVLSFRICSCVCNRGSFHELLEGFWVYHSYGFHLYDVNVPSHH